MKGLKVQFLGAMLLAEGMVFFAIDGPSISIALISSSGFITMIFGIFVGDD